MVLRYHKIVLHISRDCGEGTGRIATQHTTFLEATFVQLPIETVLVQG